VEEEGENTYGGEATGGADPQYGGDENPHAGAAGGDDNWGATGEATAGW
jgi:hypothetical protein